MKLNLALTYFLVFTLTYVADAQFNFRYGSSYFDLAKKIIPTADGNYIVTGMTKGFGSAGNGFIMKVNPSGNILWLKDYSGINIDEIWDIIELSDRSLIMCGYTNSYGFGDWDGFIMKTDSAGNILFAKAYGSSKTEFFCKITRDQDSDENNVFYIAGYAQDSLNTEGTILLKIDSLGNILWTKWTSNWDHQGRQFGGEMWVPISLTSVYKSGVVLITNRTGTGGFDIFKYSTSGNLIWSRRYNTPTGTGFGAMWGYSIIENFASDLIINFTYANSLTLANSWDDFVLKLDSSGSFISCKSYGGLYYDIFSSISNTSDGGLLLSGSTTSAGNGDFDAYLIKLDANDSVQWAKAYGGAWADYASDAVQTSDGGYILTGQSWSQGILDDSSKILIVRTDSLGNSICNDISWIPFTVIQSETTGVPFTPINFTVQNSPITWSATNRSFYTNDICIPLSVNSIYPFEESWNIAPNPFTSKTTITFASEQKNTVIKITNLLGEEMKQIILNDNEVTFEKGVLNEGVYIVQVIDQNKNISIKKLIIQ